MHKKSPLYIVAKEFPAVSNLGSQSSDVWKSGIS